jgi:N-acyl homoserine lactone hydrolase
MTEVRMYMFQCGVIRQHWHDLMMNQRLGEPVEVPIPWYLITHPRGHILIDGGNAAECAIDPLDHWGEVANKFVPVMTPEQACLPQLEAIGIDPADVRVIVQSHLHLDHTGALGVIDRLPNARVLCSRTEYEYGHAPDWHVEPAYIKADFVKPGIPWDLLDTTDDGYDVYGDGVVKLWHTPGHSPGHMSVEVTLPGSGSYMLTIDAAYTLAHWNEEALPGLLTSMSEVVRSVQKMHRLAERSQSIVVTGHDPDAWPGFKQAPEYYA